MRHGISVPCFAPFDELRRLADTARDAEAAGWDGFFVWDHVNAAAPLTAGPRQLFDPWTALTLIAAATETIRLGPLVTPLPRRRPWVVARQAVTLDHLSRGRLILGVGLGHPPFEEFAQFGEEDDARARAAKLDEGLAVLQGLWSGRPFTFSGEHYRLRDVQFLPRPLRESIPVWVAGTWPNRGPFRRAARFQGAAPLPASEAAGLNLTPSDIEEIGRFLLGQRREFGTDTAPFDLVVSGYTAHQDRDGAVATTAAYAEAGATWWIEHPDDLSDLDRLVQRGPPSRPSAAHS